MNLGFFFGFRLSWCTAFATCCPLLPCQFLLFLLFSLIISSVGSFRVGKIFFVVLHLTDIPLFFSVLHLLVLFLLLRSQLLPLSGHRLYQVLELLRGVEYSDDRSVVELRLLSFQRLSSSRLVAEKGAHWLLWCMLVLLLSLNSLFWLSCLNYKG